MAVIVGEADDRLVGGVLGMVRPDTLAGAGGTSAGVVGLAGPSDAVGDWNDHVVDSGQPVLAAVLGAAPVVSSNSRPAWTSLGYLAGRDPRFNGLVGVYGESLQNGVFGFTASSVPEDNAVYGQNDGAGHGVAGVSQGGTGVRGESKTSDAVVGFTPAEGKSGVLGFAPNGNALTGISDNGTGIFAQGGVFAGAFAGNVRVEGNLEVTGNLNMSTPGSDIILADVAEGFSTQDGQIIEPGTVVVLDQHGLVQAGTEAYDKKVAGVVSGAGNYRPAITLDQRRAQVDQLPVALMGKVCCKVDADYSPIEVGDLLTTSPTPGHAMKAADPLKAFGSVIGKALRSLDTGQGMIPILVALQ